MAIPLPYSPYLQGNIGGAVPGVAQAGIQNTYNPQATASPVSSTISSSATSPKAQYVQTKAKQIQPTSQPTPPADNNPAALASANQNYFNANPNVFGTPQQNPPGNTGNTPTNVNNPGSAAPTNFNGLSGGTTGVYDPYNSPAYQSYLNNYINSQLPGLTTPQIQSGTVAASQTLGNIAQQVSQQTSSALNNPNLSEEALTGRTMAAAKQGAYESAAVQPLLDLYKQQQGQAGTAYGAGLNAANANAGYLGGLVKPTAVSPGQSLVLPNPATGGASTLASVGAFGLGTNQQTGQPLTYNQQTGSISQPNLNLGNSALNPLNNVGSIAQQVLSGQISPSQAYAMGGSVQNWQGLLNQALQQAQPGFDQSSAQATYDANQSSQTAQKQKVADMTSAFQSGQNLQSQLKDLITTFGINPNDVNSLNSGLQLIKKNTSSAQYQALHNYVTDLVSTYASILTPGVSTESTRAKADSLLDPTMSGQSMLDTLSSLDQQAKAKIAGVPTKPTTGSSASEVFGWNP